MSVSAFARANGVSAPEPTVVVACESDGVAMQTIQRQETRTARTRLGRQVGISAYYTRPHQPCDPLGGRRCNVLLPVAGIWLRSLARPSVR